MSSPAYELARCLVCGGAPGREIADGESMRAEVEALWAFHTRRLRTQTPPEHLTDRLAFSQRPPLRLVRCDECGLVYRNPVERARELKEAYGEEAPTPEVLAALHDTQRAAYRAQARRLTRQAGGTVGRGLEVGSYVGGFLAAARELGCHFEGLDVSRAASDYARSLGLHVTDGTIEDFARDAALEGRFAAVAFWNCFDQLADPRAATVAARRLLAPDGLLALRVPNGAFYAALRPLLRTAAAPVARLVLAHSNLLTFPYRYGFSPHSIARLLGDFGFRVHRIVGDVLVPIADRWTRRWAAAEERLVKAVLTPIGRAGGRAGMAPWMEVYARPVRG
ncbi:MAG: class I SAM-dependent methyltransferase [Gemmatimonadota bacterium]|nr:class I SAM-dependent methyltransferase [Gemmatimonadota bacterium]